MRQMTVLADLSSECHQSIQVCSLYKAYIEKRLDVQPSRLTKIVMAFLSFTCEKQYDCNYAPFQFDGVTYSWWNDKGGKSQTFWAGNNASVHTCQCGIDHNCAETTTTCNCDSTVPVPLTDSGK